MAKSYSHAALPEAHAELRFIQHGKFMLNLLTAQIIFLVKLLKMVFL
jgi:hypothetical protein